MLKRRIAIVSMLLSIACGFSQERIAKMETYSEMRKQFILTYNKTIAKDTLLHIEGQEYQVSLKHRCLFDSAVVIPPKFIWEGAKRRFVTHNFVADITIWKNGSVLYKKTITKNKFRNILFERENRYGVMVASNFYKYKRTTKTFVFTFSISIPVTDLGEGVILLVDSEGKDTVKQSLSGDE